MVVVVRNGELVFSRTVSNGPGGHITDRIANELAIQPAEADRLKRHMPAGTPPEMVSRVLAITDPLVAEITEEIGDSLDYFTSQPGGEHVAGVTITGGGSLLVGLEDRLGRRLGVPVRFADPFQGFALDANGVEPHEWPFLAPIMTLAVGVALGGERGTARQINLLPEPARMSLRARSPILVGGVVAALLLGGGGYLVMNQQRALSDAKAKTAQLEQEVSAAREQAIKAGDTGRRAAADVASAQAVLQQARVTDVDWATVAEQLAAVSEPLGVAIGSLSGSARDAGPSSSPPSSSSTSPSTTAAPAGSAVSSNPALGTLSVSGVAPDLYVVAAWIDAVGADRRFDAAWVDSTTASPVDSSIAFTATIAVTRENLVVRPALEEKAP